MNTNRIGVPLYTEGHKFLLLSEAQSANVRDMQTEAEEGHARRALLFLWGCARTFDGVPVLAWLSAVHFQYERGQMSRACITQGGGGAGRGTDRGPRTSLSQIKNNYI